MTVIEAVGAAYSEAGAALLDTHVDPDHDRAVHTLAGRPGRIAAALAAGAKVAVDSIDLTRNHGVHPHVGAIDVVPLVHLSDRSRGTACAEALVTADSIARSARVPVFLYGALSGGRARAELREGGVEGLAERVEMGLSRPDFGPRRLEPRSGAALVGARPVMVAFNLLLDPSATLETAKAVASKVREGGEEGLSGVRALGLELASVGRVQVSANLENPDRAGIAEFHAAVSRHVAVESGELVGLAPRAVLDAVPPELALPGVDPELHSIEGCLRLHGIGT